MYDRRRLTEKDNAFQDTKVGAPLHFVIDDMIPFARDAFSDLGSVTLLPGRAITRETIRDADALIVRSITTVNAALLDDRPVRFVGTATTGVDHIDQQYLADRNIMFAAALGCNANAVAEYVLTALLAAAHLKGLVLQGTTIGIIGVGRIGSLVARRTKALGMRPILNDPPLERATGDPRYRPLAEALQADVLTLHVPLTVEGADATLHLIGNDELARMTPSAILINTSRGAVVDNDALLEALTQRTIGGAVMDVWEGEPSINWNLLRQVTLGTPHIAGHSFDGKVNGTVMIYHACCRFLDRPPKWQPLSNVLPATGLPPGKPRPLLYDGPCVDFQTPAHEVTTTLYDLYGDCKRMMKLLDLPEAMRAEAFDQLRHDYPKRREFAVSPVALRQGTREIMDRFKALGIPCSQA
ncbi:MAG: 4-phosphoerythronate dehydrogenase [Nitrospira sp.]|nr:4-phosphoerythronate dehydrogenase [Nitrospira sp.]